VVIISIYSRGDYLHSKESPREHFSQFSIALYILALLQSIGSKTKNLFAYHYKYFYLCALKEKPVNGTFFLKISRIKQNKSSFKRLFA